MYLGSHLCPESSSSSSTCSPAAPGSASVGRDTRAGAGTGAGTGPKLLLLVEFEVVHDDCCEEVHKNEILRDDEHEKVQKHRVNAIVNVNRPVHAVAAAASSSHCCRSLCYTYFVVEFKPVIQGDELKECETRSVHGTELRRQHITKHAHAHNREHICSSQTATYRIA